MAPARWCSHLASLVNVHWSWRCGHVWVRQFEWQYSRASHSCIVEGEYVCVYERLTDDINLSSSSKLYLTIVRPFGGSRRQFMRWTKMNLSNGVCDMVVLAPINSSIPSHVFFCSWLLPEACMALCRLCRSLGNWRQLRAPVEADELENVCRNNILKALASLRYYYRHCLVVAVATFAWELMKIQVDKHHCKM